MVVVAKHLLATDGIHYIEVILILWYEILTKFEKVTKEIPNTIQKLIWDTRTIMSRFINELWWFIRIVATDDALTFGERYYYGIK